MTIERRTLLAGLGSGLAMSVGSTLVPRPLRAQGVSDRIFYDPAPADDGFLYGEDPDFTDDDRRPMPPDGSRPEDWYIGSIPDQPFPIPVVDPARIPPVFRRALVRFQGPERPGSVVVDPVAHFLYLVREDGMAMRYGVGVGRAGFSWAGDAVIRRKAAWPDWRPPAEMRKRQPELPAFVAGGPENPLGARALYLFQGEKDTLYRIHGTMEPWSIGQSVSSGCIRLLNEDIYDLHRRVPIGTQVVVRPA